MSNKLPTKILYDFVDTLQNNYIKEAKVKKDKQFYKGVDAILTATTIVKMKIAELEKAERILIENTHMAGQRNAGIDPSAHSALFYYNSLLETDLTV